MRASIGGSDLAYEIDGPADAPPVLLWHGAAMTLRMWDGVVERLRHRYRLLRFDIRGVGASAPAADPARDYTFERYAEDASALLDLCGIARSHVRAMAWGSRAALAYCSLKPQRVISAALYDASIGVADPAAQQNGSRIATAAGCVGYACV